ncbi:hypothetical protein AB0F30_07975 [Streptomyces sp. NPDC029006]|uniref:transketolase family protein n=1 Tax=Streptomyces sp. NPDC029006 TaxID=3155467 RepID=UPI0033C5B681
MTTTPSHPTTTTSDTSAAPDRPATPAPGAPATPSRATTTGTGVPAAPGRPATTGSGTPAAPGAAATGSGVPAVPGRPAATGSGTPAAPGRPATTGSGTPAAPGRPATTGSGTPAAPGAAATGSGAPAAPGAAATAFGAPATPSRPTATGSGVPATPSLPTATASAAPVAPAPLSGRDAYRDELTLLAVRDPSILCLEADLGGKGHPFQAAHPGRFFNLGIAEGAMVDMAAGLAAGGYRPFVSTFAPFAALRAAESLKLTLGYLNAGVTVVAPYAGVSGAWFGTTHHCLEDLAILRSIPGVTIAAPYGEAEMRAVIRAAARSGRPHYIRTGRNARYASLDLPAGDELPPVVWEFQADPDAVCLVSVGEEGTRLAVEARTRTPGTAHAHLVYADHEHLTRSAAELACRHSRFVVVEEHRGQGGVAEALALLLPRCEVTSVAADRRWPSHGGDHAEVMAALGLDLDAVLRALTRAGTPHPTSHSRSLACTS